MNFGVMIYIYIYTIASGSSGQPMWLNLPFGDFLKNRRYGLLSTCFHNGHLSCVAFRMSHTSHIEEQEPALWVRTSQASPSLVFLQRHNQHQPVPRWKHISNHFNQWR
jgi:hypothetical protein